MITGYGGKTIEVLNTDAEGRLILADAVSFCIRDEGITKLLDIATLTGAAWNALAIPSRGRCRMMMIFTGYLKKDWRIRRKNTFVFLSAGNMWK